MIFARSAREKEDIRLKIVKIYGSSIPVNTICNQGDLPV